MLTAGPDVVPGRADRRHAMVALLWPSARHARLGRVSATVAVGGAPLVAHLAAGGRPSRLPVAVLAVAAGAAVAWSADDPAAELFSACPVGSPRRTQVRVALSAAAASVMLLAVVTMVAPWHDGRVLETDRLSECAAAGAVGLAVGLFAWRRGDAAGGIAGVSAGFIAPFVITALSIRWPAALPTLAAGTRHDRWWAIAAAAAVAAAGAGRDLGRRRLSLRL